MSFVSGLSRAFPVPQALLPPSVGIDISDASIRWLALDKDEKGVRVRSWGEDRLESGIVVQGVIQDAVRLGDALTAIRKRLGGIVCAHASLPEEAAYVFSMRVPDVSDRAQVLNVIGFELEGRVPIAPDAAVYDFDITPGRDASGVEIGVVVFSREFAQSYVDAFELGGMHLLSLELEARSIARAVCAEAESGAVELVVDFGRSRTGLAVVKGGTPIFTSTVGIGGEAMTHAIMDRLSLSPEQARVFNDEQGLVADGGPLSSGVEVIAGTASAFADEVLRHFRYWDSRRNEEGERVTPVDRILLVGGSANLRGLDDYIAGRTQAAAFRPNVWTRVCDFDEYIPPIDRRTSLQFATAIGLALRGV